MGTAIALLSAVLACVHAPHDVAEIVVLSPGFAQDRTLFASLVLTDRRAFGRSTDGGRSWQVYGLPMLSERLADIAFSPDFPADRTAFAATADAGVYRTTDGGSSWERVNEGLTRLETRQLAVSPHFASDRLVLVGGAAGCFRSLDGGATWRQAGDGLTAGPIHAVAIAAGAAPGQTVAYAAGKVLHRSTDGGASWTPVASFAEPVAAIVPRPRSGGAELAVCHGLAGQGVSLSADFGASFRPMNAGLPDLRVNDVAFAPGGTLFAVTAGGACLRAEAPLEAWVERGKGFERLSEQASSHFQRVEISPAFAEDGAVFVAAFEGLHHSEDGGHTWAQSDVYTQRLNRRFALSPDHATSGGIVLASYGGGPVASTQSAWEARADGISSLHGDVLVLSPAFATDRTMFYGYLGLWRSRDAGGSWELLPAPVAVTRGFACSPDFARDCTVFLGSHGEGFFRSTDAGESWTRMAGGLPPGLGASDFALSPAFAEDRTLFVATLGDLVWRSTTGGDTWSRTGLSLGPHERSIRVLGISPGFASDRTLFAGGASGQGVFVTRDAGESWEPANAGLPAEGALNVEGLALSPGFARDATLFVSLFEHGVYRSEDAGESWVRASGGLPLTAFRSVAVSRDFPRDGMLLVSTHDWLWRSLDRGGSWRRLPGYVRADDGHHAVRYGGVWMNEAVPGHHGAGRRRTLQPGAWTELEFFGDSIAFYSTRAPGAGEVRIRLDGAPAATLSLAAPAVEPQARVFGARFDAPGWHTLRVLSAGGGPVFSDGFDYTF